MIPSFPAPTLIRSCMNANITAANASFVNRPPPPNAAKALANIPPPKPNPLAADEPENVVVLGRPTKPWDLKTKATRNKEAQIYASKYLKSLNREKLLRVCSKAVTAQGDHALATLIKDSIKTPKAASEYKKFRNNPKKAVSQKLSSAEALEVVLDTGLSVATYEKVRSKLKLSLGHHVMPSYTRVWEQKRKFRPPQETITIDELKAEITLQGLAHDTAEKIVHSCQTEILAQMTSESVAEYSAKLICSWGMDGCTGLSDYKMGYKNIENPSPTQCSSIFAITLTPLQLIRNTGQEIWKNSLSQSYRTCRPIKIMYAKETKDLVLSEKELVEQQIFQLNTFRVPISSEKYLIVTFEFYMTVIDGKILSFLMNTSTQTCPICKSTPKNFNDIRNLYSGKFTPTTSGLLHGISPLHAWIRCFEFLLHSSYRLEIRQWKVTKQHQATVELRKRRIQSELWAKMHLVADFPKQGGAGSSNDGNTSRRAFANYELFAEILGVDLEIVKGVRTILIAISSQRAINPAKYQEFCHNIFFRYVQLYPWFYLPSSVHKLLIHGADIIRSSVLSVGVLGERGGESRNKTYKLYKERNSRKFDRRSENEDVFYRALDTSNPALYKQQLTSAAKRKKTEVFPREVAALFEDYEENADFSFSAVPNEIFQPLHEDHNIVLESETDYSDHDYC